jgi:hypothetical protein
MRDSLADHVGRNQAIVFRDNVKFTPGNPTDQMLCSAGQTRSADGP